MLVLKRCKGRFSCKKKKNKTAVHSPAFFSTRSCVASCDLTMLSVLLQAMVLDK